MNRRSLLGLLILVLAVGVLTCAILLGRSARWTPIEQYVQADRPARLHPDYSGTVLPPNIAPLNFLIQEPGEAFCARISSAQGETIEVFSRDSAIKISQKRWRKLLQGNKGRELHFEIFVQDEAGRWNRFQPATNLIAQEDIDGYLVYRRMPPTHLRVRGEMSIYCRDLSSFKESVVLSNTSYEGGCVNCHAFCQNRSDKMLLGVRSTKYGVGTLLVQGGTVQEVGAKFGYTSWHPSGRMAVYAVTNIPMFYHSARNEVRDTVNLDSLLAFYDCDQQRIGVEPKLAQKDRLENWPAWSADGKYLYFCSAAKLWSDNPPSPPREYDQVKYDLVRIAYDTETHTWGEIETILSAEQTGKSAGMPRCSPDGRWLSVCLFDYGYFSGWKRESDLYLIDLQAVARDGTAAYRRLDVNSDKSESWQSWSSNSRWMVFSSKRLHGIFTRPFICYVDAAGEVHKPFVLPQKEPGFYDSCLRTLNTPELVTTPPHPTGEALARVFRSPREITVAMPITMATPGATQASASSSWQDDRE